MENDFYYNGHWLSEFGGKIISHNYGISDSHFSINVKFDNIKTIIVKNIAGWLDKIEPTYFHWENDESSAKTYVAVTDRVGVTVEGVCIIPFTCYKYESGLFFTILK